MIIPKAIAITFIVGFILVVVNLFYFDFFAFKNIQTGAKESISPAISTAPVSCPDECKTLISANTRAESTGVITPTSLPTPVRTKTSQRDFFIDFGAGESKASDWVDLVGLEANIDNSKFGKIKQVVFEASLFIPNGNQKAYARLYNVTDKHPVWYSEVNHEGGTAKLLISPPIQLDQGDKLYRVQMKTSLSDTAKLLQARIRITSLTEE